MSLFPIRHRIENLTLYSFNKFCWMVAFHYGVPMKSVGVGQDGVAVGQRLVDWDTLAQEIGDFDHAEVVTNKNGVEKVATWICPCGE